MDKLKLKEQSEKLLEIHREISGFYNSYAKSAGLTPSGFEVLNIIWEEKECTQITIAQRIFLPKQTVNAIIQKLHKNGIIEILSDSCSDKRNKIIKFTKNGRTFAENIISRAKECEYRALDAVGKEKIEELINIITLYKNNLKIDL